MNSFEKDTFSFTSESNDIDLTDGYSFSIPNAEGTIKELSSSTPLTRSLSGSTSAKDIWEDAFQQADIELVKQYELDLQTRAHSSRSLEPGMDTYPPQIPISFQVPADAQKDYALLTYDAEGGYEWILPQESRTVSRSLHSHLTFYISGPTSPTAHTRTLTYSIGRKLIKLIAWKSEDWVGRKGLDIITKWENNKRPYGLHMVNPNSSEKVSPINDWEYLRQGKILLLLHGTFGTTQSSFGEMIDSAMYQELSNIYRQRIIAFNHPTLHHTPTQNVSELITFLQNKSIHLDIMTASRGGIVGREFIRQIQLNSLPIKIDRALLVASPNRGTVLADPEKMIQLIDRFTNLLTFLPVNIFSTILEGILALVKILGHGTIAGLPGLQCQAPNNDYLKKLNSFNLKGTQFYSISTDFTPDDAGWIKRMGKQAIDDILDREFGEANDGVVPTNGAYDTRPLAFTDMRRSLIDESFFYIPVSNRMTFRNSNNMHHLNYFTYPDVQHQVLRFLMY